jgi:hypothetical protein
MTVGQQSGPTASYNGAPFYRRKAVIVILLITISVAVSAIVIASLNQKTPSDAYGEVYDLQQLSYDIDGAAEYLVNLSSSSQIFDIDPGILGEHVSQLENFEQRLSALSDIRKLSVIDQSNFDASVLSIHRTMAVYRDNIQLLTRFENVFLGPLASLQDGSNRESWQLDEPAVNSMLAEPGNIGLSAKNLHEGYLALRGALDEFIKAGCQVDGRISFAGSCARDRLPSAFYLYDEAKDKFNLGLEILGSELGKPDSTISDELGGILTQLSTADGGL